MGKVFTREALELGYIPTPDSFELLINYVRIAFRNTPGIVAASLIGSTVVSRERGPRSDIDVVVLYEMGHRQFVECVRPLYQMAQGLHIPFMVIGMSSGMLKGNMHDISPGLAQHIVDCLDRGMLKGEAGAFNELHLVGRTELFGDMWNFATRKAARLLRLAQKFEQLNAAERAHLFTKLIEAPTHALRRVLRARGLLLHGDSKWHVLQALPRARFLSSDLIDRYQGYLELDKEYSEFVVARVRQIQAGRLEFDDDSIDHVSFSKEFDGFQERFLELAYSVPIFLHTMLVQFEQQ